MLIAVLTRRGRVPLAASEVYASTVGGVALREPASDLALTMALASACMDRPLSGDLVAFGEIGLAGEVRTVTGIERRLSEAKRLGFAHAITPEYDGPVPDGLVVSHVRDVQDALSVALREVARG
jgi:DNA repair protein RadA/Sms